MKKILTRIFSVALALAIALPAAAAGPQLAQKAKDNSALSELKQKYEMLAGKPGPMQKVKGAMSLQTRKAKDNSGLRLSSSILTVKPTAKAPLKVIPATGQMPDLIGSDIYNDENTGGVGLCEVPYAEGQEFNLIASKVLASFGGVLKDGIYYATNYVDYGFFAFVTITAVEVETGNTLYTLYPEEYDCLLLGAAYDATTDQIYAVGYNADLSGYQLATIAYSESGFSATPIAAIDENIRAIACDAEGQLYAITMDIEEQGDDAIITGSALQKLDKTTGEFTMIGATGLAPQYASGAVIDPKSGRMFMTVSPADDTGFLSEINLTTGAATTIYMFPLNNEVVGLQVLPPAAEDGAPAKPTDLALEFPNGALTGNVNFSIPATTFDGTAATGEVSYTVLANGNTVATGTAAYGAEVSAVAEVDKPGIYEFVVYTTNSTGDSPKARITEFIGNGVPTAPKPVLAYADGTLTLTWDAVTTSVDGGYINVDAVTYTVTNLSTNEVVAENIAATEWSCEQAEPEALTTFSFSVSASCNGLTSEVAKSNSITLGSVIPPYVNDFADADKFSQFTVIDANEDGKTWVYYDGAARIDYNSSLDMDDWLISPAVKLEAGKAYQISVDTKVSSSYYNERFAVCVGTAATAEAMTSTIIEPTDIAHTAYETYSDYFMPEADGIYYFGIHGISDKDKFNLYVDNFSIGAGISTSCPGKPENFVVTPATYGALFATVSFNAPDKTFGGAELSEITKIEVARDGELIAVKENVTPGAAIKIADGVEEAGTYTYSVVAYNEEGAGEAATTEVYIGVCAPTAPTNLQAKQVGNDIELTWTAPVKDVNGNPLGPDQVKYTIGTVEGGYVYPFIENVEGTTYTYNVPEMEEQDFIQLAIAAQTEGGRSSFLGTTLLAEGPDYVDYNESFANGSISYILGTKSLYAEGAWNLFKDADLGIPSYDGDNGCAAMKGQYLDASAMIFTGKISLEGLTNPGVTLYTYVINGGEPDVNTITISVSEPNAYEWEEIKTVAVNELGVEEGWAKVTAPLTGYEGKTIQVAITATTKQYVYTIIDNVKVGSLLSNELIAKSISAPAKVATGDDFNINVVVTNDGVKASEAFSVELYGLGANGYEVVDTKTCEALEADASTTVEFIQTMSPLATEALSFYAKVVYDADENQDNNVTEDISVAPIVSKLPAATDLKGEATEAGNVLTWNEPDLTAGVPDAVTDDFEDAESFTEEYKDWIFVDVDQAGVGGFQTSSGATIELPGIESNTPHSWFVFDASLEQFNTTYAAASGDKYLACLFRYDDGTVDDWAISPALNGSAQTISFKAKSYSDQYPDAFEIWISTGSTDVNDFTKLSEKQNVKTTNWTDYSYDLPEGTKRFAIRSCATSSFMLMVDDVTYIPADAVVDLTLVGYDIYRNGEKINAEVVAETTYTDTEAAAGEKATYNVVAIYTTGASAPSNTLELTTSGLDSIFGGINIAAGKGEVIITGAEGLAVQVVAIDGKVLFSGIAEAKTTVDVLPGVYVVKAGEKIAKLLVR